MASKLSRPIGSFAIGLLIAVSLFLASCPGPEYFRSKVPQKSLWAWERPEGFEWLEGRNDVGVAYLAQTIVLKGTMVDYRPRLQPIDIPIGVFVTAVTRIETGRGSDAAAFTDHQLVSSLLRVLQTAEQAGVGAVQIDFDAAKSERDFYKKLLKEIRQQLPVETPLSITAIASWCTGDRWIKDLPVDDVVPMVFDMGADDERIKRYLRSQKDWTEPLCRNSYGIAGYDKVSEGIKPERRFYYFNRRSWNESDFKNLIGEK